MLENRPKRGRNGNRPCHRTVRDILLGFAPTPLPAGEEGANQSPSPAGKGVGGEGEVRSSDYFFPLAATSCLRVLAFGEPGPTLLVGRTRITEPGKPGIPPRTRSRFFSASILTTVKFRMVMRSLP